MKSLTIAIIVVISIVASSAKPHGSNGKIRPARPHETTNRMSHNTNGDHHHRNDRPTESSPTVNNSNPTTNSKSQSGTPPELQLHFTEHNIRKAPGDQDEIPMESERLIHVTPKPTKIAKSAKARKTNGSTKVSVKSHARRGLTTGSTKPHHNKNTPLASGGRKKPHHKTNSSASGKPHHKHSQQVTAGVRSTNIKVKAASIHAPAGTKGSKTHKPVKKYNTKKHGWKKTLRKEKAIEKQKEKRERREKKGKGLHRSIVKKN